MLRNFKFGSTKIIYSDNLSKIFLQHYIGNAIRDTKIRLNRR